MLSKDPEAPRTLYNLLQIHPAAPLDLVSAAYWRLAAQAHAARRADEASERRLADLTEAYRVLSDSDRRHAYDLYAGLTPQAVAPGYHTPKKRSLWARVARKAEGEREMDHYELLRVDPSASAGIIHEAYPIIRGFYMRLVRAGQEPVELLDRLEEAYAVVSDQMRRLQYDQQRTGLGLSPPPPQMDHPTTSAQG